MVQKMQNNAIANNPSYWDRLVFWGTSVPKKSLIILFVKFNLNSMQFEYSEINFPETSNCPQRFEEKTISFHIFYKNLNVPPKTPKSHERTKFPEIHTCDIISINKVI